MNFINLIIIAISLVCLGTNHTFSQGCSDAGFCTMNSFKPNSVDSVHVLHNQFKIGTFFGKADNSISVYGNYLEYSRQFSQKLGLDVKLTTIGQNGNNIATLGLSDIFVNANYKASANIKLTFGAKMPLSDASNTFNNLPLPLDYQASLGTFDLIFGIGYEINKFQIVAAIQQPLTQNNNQFMASKYPINAELSTFQSTNKFERSGDVLLRISYPVNLNSKLKLTPSVLPIYHLTNDKYTDEFNVKKAIIGSQGLTLNGNVYIDYEFNNRHFIQLNLGMPFVVRQARPDGLTRSFIANIEYRLKF